MNPQNDPLQNQNTSSFSANSQMAPLQNTPQTEGGAPEFGVQSTPHYFDHEQVDAFKNFVLNTSPQPQPQVQAQTQIKPELQVEIKSEIQTPQQQAPEPASIKEYLTSFNTKPSETPLPTAPVQAPLSVFTTLETTPSTFIPIPQKELQTQIPVQAVFQNQAQNQSPVIPNSPIPSPTLNQVLSPVVFPSSESGMYRDVENSQSLSRREESPMQIAQMLKEQHELIVNLSDQVQKINKKFQVLFWTKILNYFIIIGGTLGTFYYMKPLLNSALSMLSNVQSLAGATSQLGAQTSQIEQALHMLGGSSLKNTITPPPAPLEN